MTTQTELLREAQYQEWCARHDLPPNWSREAFEDAASLAQPEQPAPKLDVTEGMRRAGASALVEFAHLEDHARVAHVFRAMLSESPASPQAEQAEAARPETELEESTPEDELNCAEEWLDHYAAQLNLGETDFNCIGDYIRAVVEAALLADSKDAGEPVLYQYRWLNPAGDRVEPGSLLEWKLVEVRNVYTDTIEGRVRELEAYRHQDKPVYEVRALYTRPQAADAQPMTEYHCIGYIDGYDRNIKDTGDKMKSPHAVYVASHGITGKDNAS